MSYILILLKSVSHANQLLKRKDSVVQQVWESYLSVRDSQYTRYKAFGNSYWEEAYFFNPGFPNEFEHRHFILLSLPIKISYTVSLKRYQFWICCCKHKAVFCKLFITAKIREQYKQEGDV